MVDLSVVILSWNVRDLLRQCLASLAAQHNPHSTEIIVVDNASSDGSVAMVRAEFPHVKLVVNATNRGYTGGNNDGLAVAAGRYVLILNPDTQVVDGALATLVNYAQAHPEAGLIGPQLLNPDGTVQSSRRRFPTCATALFESTWLQPIAPRRVLRDYYMDDRPAAEIHQVDWVVGACMLVPREVIDRVGRLDEGFFMYSEELDWCRRIKQAGWQVVYVPQAQVIHHAAKSSDQVAAQRHIYFQTSKVRYFRKHHGQLAAAGVRFALLAMYVWQLALEALKGLVGSKRPLRRERVRAYWQVLRSGLAPRQ